MQLHRRKSCISPSARRHYLHCRALPRRLIIRPGRSVFIAGFPPGGVNDTYARLIGGWLSGHLGQQFIVENHAGAGGTLADEYRPNSAGSLPTKPRRWGKVIRAADIKPE
jgi:hypothetical protein